MNVNATWVTANCAGWQTFGHAQVDVDVEATMPSMWGGGVVRPPERVPSTQSGPHASFMHRLWRGFSKRTWILFWRGVRQLRDDRRALDRLVGCPDDVRSLGLD